MVGPKWIAVDVERQAIVGTELSSLVENLTVT